MCVCVRVCAVVKWQLTLGVHLPVTLSLMGWSASHFYTNHTTKLYNRYILENTQTALFDSFFLYTFVSWDEPFASCHLGLEHSCLAILNRGLANEVTHSPLPPSALLRLSLQDCKLLEFLFLAAQIPSCFLQCTAAKAAGRLVYSTANLSVTPHGH